ncbi:hypothetical protein ACFL2K_05270, partial [Candidatus Margulisiibacteriota bacterium]
LVFDLDSTVEISTTTGIEITEMLDEDGATVNFQGYTPINSVTVSGLAVQTAVNTSPAIVIPGQDSVEMLKISLQVLEESIKEGISFTIKNDEANFANTDGGTVGVTKVYLYQDTNDNGTLETGQDDLWEYISGTNFTSESEAVFDTPPSGFELTNGTTENFFVVYDIGDDTNVTNDTLVKAQLTNFSGTGDTSKLPIALSSSVPVLAASANVAGLSYDELESIVPTGKTFGPGTTVPVLKFQLTANNVAVTVNQITIQNNGSVKYITDSTDTTGITKIQLFEDTNNDYEYDGAGLGDTLIASLDLGSGQGQTKTSAPLNISYDGNGLGMLMPTDDEKIVFVVYDLGEGINVPTITTGSVSTTSNAVLEDVVGSTNISTAELSLSGTLPVAADPNAVVSIQAINIRILEITDVSPTGTVQGQIKVPMLHIKTRAEQDLDSAVMTIFNNKASYLSNDSGISKVWLYLDVNKDQVLDINDTLLSATSSFTSVTRVNMPAFDLSQGENEILVCYDFGQAASTGGPNVACQLDDIVSSGSATSIVLGGETPLPKVPALVTANASLIGINSISVNTSNVFNTSTSFNAQVNITNSGAAAVQITTIDPRFYYLTKDGKDISYELGILGQTTIPVTINASQTLNFIYEVGPKDIRTEGTVYVDGFVEYKISSGNYAVKTRYKGSGTEWTLAAGSNFTQLTFNSNLEDYAWLVPEYIESVKIESGGTELDFENYDTIPANSTVILYFKDQARYLDEAQIQVTLRQESLSTTTNNNSYETQATTTEPIYAFNRETGYLKIYNIGSENGELNITLTDLDGNTLSQTNLTFYISDTVKIYNFLCYPNPYSINSGALKMGFNLTQPASVGIYLYSSIGHLIWSYTTSYA